MSNTSLKGELSWLSASHMHLLSLFLKPRPIASITNPGWNQIWAGVLGEPPEMALARLKEAGMIETAEEVNGLAAFQCSTSSQLMAEQFRDQQKAQQEAAESRAMNLLRNRQYTDACLTMARHEASRPFPRGVGGDWRNYKPQRDADYCWNLLEEKEMGSEEETQALAACMMRLFGASSPKKWLPGGRTRRVSFEEKIAVIKAGRPAYRKAELETIKQNLHIFSAVAILAAGKCCSVCLADDGEWPFDKVPSLPHEDCENGLGCRCMYQGVIEGREPKHPRKKHY